VILGKGGTERNRLRERNRRRREGGRRRKKDTTRRRDTGSMKEIGGGRNKGKRVEERKWKYTKCEVSVGRQGEKKASGERKRNNGTKDVK
jgi:hypothetical protein